MSKTIRKIPARYQFDDFDYHHGKTMYIEWKNRHENQRWIDRKETKRARGERRVLKQEAREQYV